MATSNFTFTTLSGTETAGWNSINALINNIDLQLNNSNRLVYMAGGTPTSGYTITWDSGNSRWSPGQVGAAAIANNAVELGTKTTGDYVASIAAAGSNEVSVTGSGEGATATVRLADNTALRGAATVQTPPTYSGGSTGTTGRIADAKYVTDALAYATSGNVTLSGDVTGNASANTIATGAVTSAKILDGTIVNGDISSSAAIAYSKLNLAGSITKADLVTALQQLLIPVGTLMPFAGLAASKPTGWFICDGSSFASNGLSAGNALYDLLVAAGWSALPDLQGRTIAGTGTGSGLSARALRDIFGQETLPAHTHSISAWATTDGAGAHSHSVSHTDQVYQGTGPGIWPAGNNGVNGYGAGNQGHTVSTNGAHNHTIPATNTNSTGTGTHGVMQPTLFLNYIIKG